MLGLGVGMQSDRGLSSPYHTGARAYFLAMTTQPDAARKALIDTLFKGLESDGTLPLLDWLCLLASHDSQSGLLNAKQPSKTGTLVGTVTFTADKGFKGDGSTGYILLENAQAAGNQSSTNSASQGVYCNLSVGTGFVGHMGKLASSAGNILARATAGAETFRLNDSASDQSQLNTGSHLGHRYSVRPSAAVKRAFFNGARVADLTTASTSASNSPMVLLQAAGGSFSSDQLGAAWSGGGMTDTQANAVHTRLDTYLRAIGAGY